MFKGYKTCLLIDDNYIDNFVTRRILENSNFAENIVVQQSAFDAIDAIKTGQVKPDVIFLDLRMPMMNGFEFCRNTISYRSKTKAPAKYSCYPRLLTRLM